MSGENLQLRYVLFIAALLGFSGVALGAFAAHVLKEKLSPDLFSVFDVGVRYHLIHALALFAVAWTMTQFPEANLTPAAWLFVGGIFIFSGSLYLMSLTGMRWLGAITPIGGLAFLAGWGWLGWKFWRML